MLIIPEPSQGWAALLPGAEPSEPDLATAHPASSVCPRLAARIVIIKSVSNNLSETDHIELAGPGPQQLLLHGLCVLSPLDLQGGALGKLFRVELVYFEATCHYHGLSSWRRR